MQLAFSHATRDHATLDSRRQQAEAEILNCQRIMQMGGLPKSVKRAAARRLKELRSPTPDKSAGREVPDKRGPTPEQVERADAARAQTSALLDGFEVLSSAEYGTVTATLRGGEQRKLVSAAWAIKPEQPDEACITIRVRKPADAAGMGGLLRALHRFSGDAVGALGALDA